MKEFFEENVSSMSFIFSFIVLLNAVLGYFLEADGMTNSVLLALAAIILLLFAVSYGVSFIHFKSNKVFRAVNLGVQLIVFYTISLSTGLIAWSFDAVLSIGLVFVGLYFINSNRRMREVERLASDINKRLDEFNRKE